METAGTMTYGYLEGLLEREDITIDEKMAVVDVMRLMERLGDDKIEEEEK